MSQYKEAVLSIEETIRFLMSERRKLLEVDVVLSAQEVDRLFEIATEVEGCFERQAMLLPLVEDTRTQDRWDSFRALQCSQEYWSSAMYC